MSYSSGGRDTLPVHQADRNAGGLELRAQGVNADTSFSGVAQLFAEVC